MTSRLLSAFNYMLDAFLFSLCLVFIDTETVIPLVIVWLLLNAAASIVSFFIFQQVPYHLNIAVAVGVGTMSFAILAGASIGAMLIFAIVAVYRLHMRFSVKEDGFDLDSHYLFKFSLLFLVVLVISLLNPAGDTSRILYGIAVSLVVFYVVTRMLYRFLHVRDGNKSFPQLLAFLLGILGLSAAGGTLVFAIAESTRYVIASILGRVISIVLWPLAVGMEKLVDFLNSLATEEQKQQNLEKIELGEKAIQTPDSSQPAAAEFPFELIFTGILVVLLIMLIVWLRKVKPKKEEEKQESKVEIERFSASSVQTPPEPEAVSYASIDMNIIREAFRDFERAAAEAGKGRKSHETIREWLKRMGWSASAAFFDTYDFVRYGKGEISETTALPFLDEVKKLKEQYLKINV